MSQVTQLIGCSSFSGSPAVHSGEYVFRSTAVMFGHSTSVGARRHLPTSEQALYFLTVTSYKSMHTEPTVTLCGGFSLSAASLSSEPMKNWPAGICTISSGQVSGAGAAEALGIAAAADTADALASALGLLAASGASCLPLIKKKTAAASAKAPKTPPTTRPVLLLGGAEAFPVLTVEGLLVVATAGREPSG